MHRVKCEKCNTEGYSAAERPACECGAKCSCKDKREKKNSGKFFWKENKSF